MSWLQVENIPFGSVGIACLLGGRVFVDGGEEARGCYCCGEPEGLGGVELSREGKGVGWGGGGEGRIR